MERRLPWLVFGVASVVLILGTAGGPGWGISSDRAVVASQLERTTAAPLYDMLAGVAAYLPVGELGFRLALLGAVLGALTLAGVVAAASTLLRKDGLAGVVAAAMLMLAPPFRDAAGFATPSILAACGTVWAVAYAVAHVRDPIAPNAARALACSAIVIGSAPWLGAALTLVVALSLARAARSRRTVALTLIAIVALAVGLWVGAIGQLPEPSPDLTAMVSASGVGAAALLIAAGLLGTTFATVTGLPQAILLGLVIVVTAGHAICVDPAPSPMLAALAIGCAVIPSAVVQVVGSRRWRRWVVVLSGIPLVGGAVITDPALSIDDPGATPTRVASDVIGSLPPGPGVIVMTRTSLWSAVLYEQAIAGARPDLALAAPLPATVADGLVADALRAQRIVGSDVVAFGRLDPALGLPRGRGFELRAIPASRAGVPPAPAKYASEIGVALAAELALGRARYEASAGRFDAAARAAGLADRFGAGDLAMLATTQPVPQRPPLFDFIPRFDDRAAGPWVLDLFGDDLAWVAGIEIPPVEAPPGRRLHALWRELLLGKIEPTDPRIAALGPLAVGATGELLAALKKNRR